MAANSQTFYDAVRSFQKDALQPYGYVQEVGIKQLKPLQIVVEWDTKTVCLGYSDYRAYSRIQAGLEAWFDPSEYLPAHIICPENGPYDPREFHAEILDLARKAQKVLDDAPNVTDEIKFAVKDLLCLSRDSLSEFEKKWLREKKFFLQ